jgi:nicotinamidase-related amidase
MPLLSDTTLLALWIHAINAIVNEAANATAVRVDVNAATIVNEAAHSMTGRVSAISDEAEGLVGA